MPIKLTSELLLAAYSHGYFPMPHPVTEEMCWFNPEPRAILPLDGFHVSRSLARTLRRSPFHIRIDHDFASVIDGCANREETWINGEIREAFLRLHQEGHAHSFEVWSDEALVGGTYGLALGGAFFAESKFHRVRDASKIALYYLTEHLRNRGFELLEIQFLTPHLATLGAIEIHATEYQRRLQHALRQNVQFTPLSVLPLPFTGEG
jgi:leucyl/phenylalanyl-tRNA--protein transferase